MVQDPLKIFRDMLDRKNWPIEPDQTYIIIKGEVYTYVSDHPLEERIRKALYVGKMQ